MPGSTFRLCIECQAHIWVACTRCKECGAQQPATVPSDVWAQRTNKRHLNPKRIEKAATGLLQGLVMMSEKKESKRSQNTFPDCPHLFSPEIKPVITGKGKSFIAPATFSAALSPNGCPDSESYPWRQVDWSEGNMRTLMDSIHSYKPACDSVPAARVLLIGPVGAGKSSFINSVQSVFYGRVVQRTMVGTSFSPTTSFTKQTQSFQLFASREAEEETLPVILCDMVGLGETNGLALHDTLAVIKGHVPDGHMFSACCPVVPDTPGYVKEPSLAERVHCVVFVLSDKDLSSYSEAMKSTFHQLREHISALGVQQMAVLTHVDKECDVSQVYNGPYLRQAMLKASDLLGMPLSSIIPVKNYSEELELDTHTDTLLLQALDHMLLYTDLYLRDHPETGSAE